MNLFLTEDGVLKLGYYGLTTQAECYFIKETDCEGVRSFAPEVFRGEYEMKSDVWSFGVTLIEMMGITKRSSYDSDELLQSIMLSVLPFDERDINSAQLADFLEECFEERVSERWSVNELLNVSVMG